MLSSEASVGAPKPFQDIPGPKGQIHNVWSYREEICQVWSDFNTERKYFQAEQAIVCLHEHIEAVFRADQEWPNRPEGGELAQRLMKEAGIT